MNKVNEAEKFREEIKRTFCTKRQDIYKDQFI
jgi:hypothetical protein